MAVRSEVEDAHATELARFAQREARMDRTCELEGGVGSREGGGLV
jgi:hypothetical protein